MYFLLATKDEVEILQELASLKGFYVQDVPGDGSCMFASIGLQVGHTAADLRKILVSHLLANADEVLTIELLYQLLTTSGGFGKGAGEFKNFPQK